MPSRRAGLVALAALLLWAAGAVAQPAREPQRIVSLLPSLTETVCALGACDRLVGVDRHSNWPEQVAALPRLGGLEDTQIERVVALRPDLVLLPASSRAGDRLRSLGLAVLVLEPQNLAQTRSAIETLAQALGREPAGRQLLSQLDERLDKAAARVPAALRGQSVYLEVASTPYAAGAASFVGEVLARLGLVNIVPATMGPFPQLSPEYVLRADPHLVIATAKTVAEMPRRPGWGRLAALQQGRVCGLAPAPWDTLMRPGPRLADAAEALADCLRAIEQRAGAPTMPR
jgi:iron complex transport system substrate-binding protein